MKQIILNLSDKDPNSLRVIDWLFYLGTDFNIKRESSQKDFKSILISNKKSNITINDNINIRGNTYWNRRGLLSKLTFSENMPTNHLYESELSAISGFVKYAISDKSLNKESDNETNKLINLDIAAKVGLSIPKTMITSNKSDVEEFILTTHKTILKPIDRIIDPYISDTINLTNLVTLLTPEHVSKMPSRFNPIQLQEYIEKKFEIRSFVLKDTIKSAAIFSQSDEQTKIDFRNYNLKKPNRVIPYKLPEWLENNLRQFMKRIDCDTGSFDIIYSLENEYVFLEINPVGNYTQISLPMNYELEKDIAIYLINLNKNEN